MIFRSPFPDVEIPDESLPDFIVRHAAQFGDKPALIDGPSGRTLTYAQLLGGIRAMRAGLAARGFNKGDIFAVYLPNLPEYALIFHGVAAQGGVVTTINPLYTVDELTHQLNDSGAKFLITIPLFLENARSAAEASDVEEVFVLGEAEGATPFGALMGNPAGLAPLEIDPGEDVVVLPYSSGTTGLPKGVMLTHRNLVANVCQTDGVDIPELKLRTDDVLVAVLPFFHIYGMTILMNLALTQGVTIITMPRFDFGDFLGLVQKYKITVAHLVPPIVLPLAKHPVVDQFDISSLRVVASGAAPLSSELAIACAARLNCILTQGYGLTETSPVIHFGVDPAAKSYGSVGPCIPNTLCKIVDVATRAELEPDEEGEIWVSGPQVMKGYLNNPQATADTVDADGWLHTGDIGYVDEGGNLYITDRLKELIKYSGYQVAPAELEALLLTNPDIADAAVIGLPDEEVGEVPKAFVVLQPDGDLDEVAVMAFVADKVAPYKKVRAVEFVDQIPKSISGKILRRVLVERERARLESG